MPAKDRAIAIERLKHDRRRLRQMVYILPIIATLTVIVDGIMRMRSGDATYGFLESFGAFAIFSLIFFAMTSED